MRKTISVDIDGVLAQFARAFVGVVKSLYPEKNLSSDFEPNDWFYAEILNEAECKEALHAVFNVPYLWSGLEPYQDNLTALQRFVGSNELSSAFNLYYVTARAETPGDSAVELTSRWLHRHFIKPYNAQVVVVKDPKDKIAVMRGLKIEASIDDYLPTVVACQELPGHRAYLLDRPWNRSNRPAGLRVVSSLQEYLQEVSK